MNVRKSMTNFLQVILEEADQNPHFNERLMQIFDPKGNDKPKIADTAISLHDSPNKLGAISNRRPSNRRAEPVLDPVNLARQGEDTLRKALSALDLEKLRDIVAEYGMDSGKLVMKWRDRYRVIDRIIELSLTRSQKGNAFRDNDCG